MFCLKKHTEKNEMAIFFPFSFLDQCFFLYIYLKVLFFTAVFPLLSVVHIQS